MKIVPIIPFSTKPQMSKENDTWHYYTHAEYKLVLLKCDLRFREKLINYCTIFSEKNVNWISLFMILSMCFQSVAEFLMLYDHVTLYNGYCNNAVLLLTSSISLAASCDP